MGMLIDGRWSDDDALVVDGAFERARSTLAGPSALAPLVTDGVARYHLVASRSCPWSHAVVLMRELKGFGDALPLHHAHGERLEGYALDGGRPWAVPGTDRHARHLHELYTLNDPAHTGRATVPLLWDARERRVVSDDSNALLRLLNAAAVRPPAADPDLIPADLRDAIDAVCERIHHGLANAVYRAGFATRQHAYDAAVREVFATLDWLERRLGTRRFVLGRVLTVADLRLFATLVRFDAVYHPLHRCTRRRLIDYPALWAYARDLYAWPGVAGTVDLEAIREASFGNDTAHNPSGIVPLAPEANWQANAGRERLGDACLRLRDGGTLAVAPPNGAAA